MEKAKGGRGQEQAPDIPKTPDTTQLDQAALEKREQKRAANRNWRQQNPERARELSRRSSLKYNHQHPDKIREDKKSGITRILRQNVNDPVRYIKRTVNGYLNEDGSGISRTVRQKVRQIVSTTSSIGNKY